VIGIIEGVDTHKRKLYPEYKYIYLLYEKLSHFRMIFIEVFQFFVILFIRVGFSKKHAIKVHYTSNNYLYADPVNFSLIPQNFHPLDQKFLATHLSVFILLVPVYWNREPLI